MKTQVLGKKLLFPLIVIEMVATVVGLSFPAQSTSLISSQGKVIDANPEAILIARRKHKCRPQPDCNPGYMRSPDDPSLTMESSGDDEENIRSQPDHQQHQQSPNAEPLPIAKPLPNAKPLPIAEPSPQN